MFPVSLQLPFVERGGVFTLGEKIVLVCSVHWAILHRTHAGNLRDETTPVFISCHSGLSVCDTKYFQREFAHEKHNEQTVCFFFYQESS